MIVGHSQKNKNSIVKINFIVYQEDFWPDGVPYDETQSERYFSFHPGIPDSFFPNVLRYYFLLLPFFGIV